MFSRISGNNDHTIPTGIGDLIRQKVATSPVSGYGDRFTKIFAHIMASPEWDMSEKRLNDLKEFKSMDLGLDGFSSFMNTGSGKDSDFKLFKSSF